MSILSILRSWIIVVLPDKKFVGEMSNSTYRVEKISDEIKSNLQK